MNRALLTGINNYPGAELSGCINDTLNIKDLLIKDYGWKESDIFLLHNEKATKKGIIAALDEVFADVKPPATCVYSFSGHGAQVPTLDAKGEIDVLDEIICPQNFQWTPETMIRDKEVGTYFSKMPHGVTSYVLFDSCFSGDMTREPKGRKPRAFPVPIRIREQIISAITKLDVCSGFFDVEKRGVISVIRKFLNIKKNAYGSDTLPVGYISGCSDSQTSADTIINGKPCGAFTHYFIKNVRKYKKLPITELTKKIVMSLHMNGFFQTPQAEGLFKHNKFLE